MKAHGFSGVFRLSILIGAIAFHFASAATPLKQTAQTANRGESLGSLTASGKVKVETSGTGETIGHVADLKIQNVTDQPLTCAIPPMILESGSGKNQHYTCPSGQTVALNPHQTKTVPMNGVCLNRNKPPVGKGVSGDLVMNEANPTVPQNPNSHIAPKAAGDLLRICTAKYDAANKLQNEGALKNLPYKDKQKQKDIVVQWSTWCDPRISEITGGPPATREDLRKVVYKQVEVKGPMSPETKKKVDKGIDAIFSAVELTSARAKDLEKPEEQIPPVAGTTAGETPATGQPVAELPLIPQPAGTPRPTPRRTAGQTVVATPTPTGTPTPFWIAGGYDMALARPQDYKIPQEMLQPVATPTPTPTPNQETCRCKKFCVKMDIVTGETKARGDLIGGWIEPSVKFPVKITVEARTEGSGSLKGRIDLGVGLESGTISNAGAYLNSPFWQTRETDASFSFEPEDTKPEFVVECPNEHYIKTFKFDAYARLSIEFLKQLVNGGDRFGTNWYATFRVDGSLGKCKDVDVEIGYWLLGYDHASKKVSLSALPFMDPELAKDGEARVRRYHRELSSRDKRQVCP